MQTILSTPSFTWINPSNQACAHFYFTRHQASHRSSVLTLKSMLKTLHVQQPGCQISFNSRRRVCIRCVSEPDLGAVTKTVTNPPPPKKKQNKKTFFITHGVLYTKPRVLSLFFHTNNVMPSYNVCAECLLISQIKKETK